MSTSTDPVDRLNAQLRRCALAVCGVLVVFGVIAGVARLELSRVREKREVLDKQTRESYDRVQDGILKRALGNR